MGPVLVVLNTDFQYANHYGLLHFREVGKVCLISDEHGTYMNLDLAPERKFSKLTKRL